MAKLYYLCILLLLTLNGAWGQSPEQLVPEAAPQCNVSMPLTTKEEPSQHSDRYEAVVIDFKRVQGPFIISLWIFLACLGKIGFHMTPKLSHIFPESCMLIVLGLIVGAILKACGAATTSPMTADVFFIYMLPPIILDAGYFMPNRLFFDHIGTILMFAVVGTIWNAMAIGFSFMGLNELGIFNMKMETLHIFLFSSLISAVDPVAVLAVFEEIHVEEVLFILVFGESLLNDGITVVLYHMFEGFSELEEIKGIDLAYGILSFFLVAGGGTLIGIIWGFLAAFVTRFTNQVTVIEPLFIFVMSYLAYLNAEIFHFSGILSITFCGITMKNYTEQNISSNSSTTTKYAMKMLAQSAETIIFMFLGVAVFTMPNSFEEDWTFVTLTIVFCTVYRIIGVLILSAICNRFRVQQIDPVQKFVMCYGGLRGAVAFALVLTIDGTHIPERDIFLTATTAMVFFTVFFQGITIKPLVEFLGVKKSSKSQLTMNERLHGRSMDYLMAGIEDLIGRLGKYYMRDKFKRFNHKYLTPVLVREHFLIENKIIETHHQLKMQEAMDFMANKPTPASDSMAALFRNALHPSNAKVEKSNSEWNLDLGELGYIPTDRDLSAARFHRILSDEYRPISRRRQSTYKRHAVTDDEIQGEMGACHNIYMKRGHHFFGNASLNATKIKAKRKQLENQDTSSSHPTQFNGSAIKLQRDYLEEHFRDNPAFVGDEVDGSPVVTPVNRKNATDFKRYSIKGPTMAELIPPWKRHLDEECPISARRDQLTSSVKGTDEYEPMPTAAEVILPWKYYDSEDPGKPLRQAEFPAWVSNKNYTAYVSPSNTILGKLGPVSRPSAKEIFENDGVPSSVYARRGSLKCDPTFLKEDPIYRRGSLTDEVLFKRKSTKDMFQKLHDNIRHGKLQKGALEKHMRAASFDEESTVDTIIEEDTKRDRIKNEEAPSSSGDAVIDIEDNDTKL